MSPASLLFCSFTFTFIIFFLLLRNLLSNLAFLCWGRPSCLFGPGTSSRLLLRLRPRRGGTCARGHDRAGNEGEAGLFDALLEAFLTEAMRVSADLCVSRSWLDKK